jgi:transcriptional regulator with XRE-family HTH domain
VSDELPARIREALKRAGMSQKDLAEKIGAKPPALSRWLAGGRELPSAQLPAIAKALGVSYESLTAPGSEGDSAQSPIESLVRWHFRPAPKDGGQDGGNSNVYATPAGTDTLIREAGQNSGDQKESNSGLRIEVALIELTKGSEAYDRFFEAIRLEKLRAHMKASAKTPFRSSQKVRASLDRLASSDRVYMLRFSEFGATGLFGDETSRPGVHATFPSLVRDNLSSSKGDETAGGSYGLGKATLWRASGLNLVLFSSAVAPRHRHKDRDGTLRFIGKAELTWHEHGDAPFAGPGWLSDGFDSVWVEPRMLEGVFLDRLPTEPLPAGVTDTGTSVLIVDFQEPDEEQIEPDKVLDRIRLSIAGNFWPALSSGDWSAEVLHIVDGDVKSRVEVDPEETPYRPFVEAYKAHLEGEVAARPAPGDTISEKVQVTVPATRPNAVAVRPSQPSEAAHATFLVRLADDNDLEVPEINETVALIRGPLMVVKYWPRRNLVIGGKPFHGVLLAGTTVDRSPSQVAFEQFLRLAEPPSHDTWEYRQEHKDNYMRGAQAELGRFYDEVTKLIRQNVGSEDEGESEEPDLFKKLFQVPGPDRQVRLAKLRGGPELRDGAWGLAGTIKVLDRQKPIRATIGLSLVPESGKSTPLPWDSLEVVRATRGEATVDGGVIVIEAGTTSVDFKATATGGEGLPRMDRCVARATEHYARTIREGEELDATS